MRSFGRIRSSAFQLRRKGYQCFLHFAGVVSGLTRQNPATTAPRIVHAGNPSQPEKRQTSCLCEPEAGGKRMPLKNEGEIDSVVDSPSGHGWPGRLALLTKSVAREKGAIA